MRKATCVVGESKLTQTESNTQAHSMMTYTMESECRPGPILSMKVNTKLASDTGDLLIT